MNALFTTGTTFVRDVPVQFELGLVDEPCTYQVMQGRIGNSWHDAGDNCFVDLPGVEMTAGNWEEANDAIMSCFG